MTPPPSSRRLSLFLSSLLLPLLLSAVAVAAPLLERPSVSIGPDATLVRQYFPPSGQREISTILWTNPPPEIDLSSLRVWSPKRPAALRSWSFLPAPPALPAGFSATPAGRLAWTPSAPAAPLPPRPLRLDLLAPLSHALGHSLTYSVHGPVWSASYALAVRGLSPSSQSSVQIDLAGSVHLHNPTALSFPLADILLLGPVDSLPPAPPSPPGSPALDRDSPLSAPWFPAPPEPPPSIAIRLPSPLPVLPYSDSEATFLDIRRKPAAIVFEYDSNLSPYPSASPDGLPLLRTLRLPNDPRIGLGFPLLPGALEWSIDRADRRDASRSVRVPYTPFPGTLRVPLDSPSQVRTARLPAQIDAPPNAPSTATCTLRIFNDFNAPVTVELSESPPFPAWSLLRASHPCTRTDSILHFTLTIPPSSSLSLTYRLRL